MRLRYFVYFKYFHTIKNVQIFKCQSNNDAIIPIMADNYNFCVSKQKHGNMLTKNWRIIKA